MTNLSATMSIADSDSGFKNWADSEGKPNFNNLYNVKMIPIFLWNHTYINNFLFFFRKSNENLKWNDIVDPIILYV